MKWIIKLFYLVFLFTASVLLLEGALRFFDRDNTLTLTGKKQWLNFEEPFNHTLVCYPSNPRGYFDIDLRDEEAGRRYSVNPEDRRSTPFCVEEKYNLLGYRDREFDAAAAGAKVVFLGDSFVSGEGVREEDRFTNILAQGYWKNKVKIYNLGKCGAGVPNILKQHLPEALKLSPELIVYCYVLNDPSLCGEISLRKNAINDLMNMRFYNSDIYRFYKRRLDGLKDGSLKKKLVLIERQAVLNSRLIFMLRRILLDRFIAARTVQWYRDMYTSRNQCWQESSEMIVEIARSCRQNNVDFALVILPIFYDFRAYPFQGIHDKLKDLCLRNKIEVFDTLEGFRGADYRDYIVHALDYHPNEKANRKIAGQINNFLREKINKLASNEKS